MSTIIYTSAVVGFMCFLVGVAATYARLSMQHYEIQKRMITHIYELGFRRCGDVNDVAKIVEATWVINGYKHKSLKEGVATNARTVSGRR